MTTVKGIFLGSVASLLAIGAAQAADLPVKAKAVEYVRICSAYGAGFWYIPGTDTCMKIGGYFRADVTFNGSVHGQPAWSGDLGQQNCYRDYFTDRARMALTFDTRTASEYGVVRTFGQANFQFSTQASNTVNPASFTGSPTTGTQSNLLGQPGDGYVAVEYIFIQFAGFTFGKSASAYATPWQGFPGNISSFLLGGQNTDTGVNNIQYTAQFGNGVSGTIGLDDPVVWDRTNVYNLSLPLNATLGGSNVYAGVRAPDVVGNIRVDQAWGLFQISADAHEVSGSYNVLNTAAVPAGAIGPAGGLSTGLSEISGHPDAKWGGSVMAALQIKNIPTGPGDDLKMDVSYAKGVTKNVIATAASSPSFAMYRRQQYRLSERRLRGDHRRGVSSGIRRRRWFAASDRGLRHPRRIQPQLGSRTGPRVSMEAIRPSAMTAPRRPISAPTTRRRPRRSARTIAATPTTTSRSLASSPAGCRSRT